VKSRATIAAARSCTNFRNKSDLTWTAIERPLRNVAVIAHVDHGKTTMVDRLMQAGGESVGSDRMMDSNDLERERGITILSKVTSFDHNNTTVQLVDTPGHADFSGEVQRICSMVDGALLLVDAREGVCPQTRFVLAEALSRGLTPIVVFNKCDREDSRIGGPVEDEVLDLLINLGASDEQLEYPTLYASARDGWAVTDVDLVHNEVERVKAGIMPVLDAIVDHIPRPRACGSDTDPLRFLVTQMSGDQFLGRLVTGKVSSGSVRVGDSVRLLDRTGVVVQADGKITKILKQRGMVRGEVDVALPGDIVTLAGAGDGVPSMTVAHPSVDSALPADAIDPPTLGVVVAVNDSPLAGKAGKFMTSAQITKRLIREAESNVSITVESAASSGKGSSEAVEMRGRGELQLAVILETMRREGFEMSVSPPRVVFRTDEDGNEQEPWEEVTMDLEEEHAGTQVEKMQLRSAEMHEYAVGDDGRVKLVFTAPARSLLGLQSDFRTDTRGSGVMYRSFDKYGPKVPVTGKHNKGALISSTPGIVAAYALRDLEARGTLFVRPGDEVYTGQVIGEHVRVGDLDVNAVRAKKLTNMRASGTDETIRLAPPREFTLEEAITALREDELLEVTPERFRIRKQVLDPSLRKTAARKAKK
jgi:GTP-binding protein